MITLSCDRCKSAMPMEVGDELPDGWATVTIVNGEDKHLCAPCVAEVMRK